MDDTQIYDARIELVDFVIEVLHDTPQRDFVERLLGDEIRLPDGESNPSLDQGFDHLRAFIETNRDRPLDEVVDELQREYTRVFVGPRPPVLAHETYYRDDTEFIGEGLAAVQASYAAAGWASPDDYGEEDDFIAVETAFLRALIDRQRRGEDAAVDYERVFLDQHLLEWYSPFQEDVHRETDEPLFLAVADVFAGLVEFEEELVAQQTSTR